MLVISLEKIYRRETMKTYKVWAQQTTFLYAYVEAESEEKAWDLALQKDGSEFTEKGDGGWDIYNVEEVTNG
jgi:hypothetical protein